MVSKLGHWAKGARIHVLILCSILTVIPLLNWIGLSCFVFWFLDEERLPRKVIIAFIAAIFLCMIIAVMYSDVLPIITLLLVLLGVALTWMRISFNIMIATLALIVMLGISFASYMPVIFNGVMDQARNALLTANEIIAAPALSSALMNAEVIVQLLPITMLAGSFLLAVIILMIGKYMLLSNHSQAAAQIDLLSHKLNISSGVVLVAYVLIAVVLGMNINIDTYTLVALMCGLILLPFAMVIELNCKSIWKGQIAYGIVSILYRFLLVCAIVWALMPIDQIGVTLFFALTALPIIANFLFDFQAKRINTNTLHLNN